jgi:iron complex transport system substrate-binding protein
MAQAQPPQRIATVDWAVLETLLALGKSPVAATELRQFAEIAVEPAVPKSIADLGLRGVVNLEMLLLSRPDLIFSSNFYASTEDRLRAIAPVESFTIYAGGIRPFAASEAMTAQLGTRLGISETAKAYLTETTADMTRFRDRLASVTTRPVIPINLGDPRHFRVFGHDSMFGEVLARLGLANAWTQATSYSALAPIGLEALASVPEAWIVLLPPTPPDAARTLATSAFWNALPPVREGRLLELAAVNPYGALPAARRFARLLTEALLRAREAGRG